MNCVDQIHPDPSRLADFALGRMAPAEQAAVERHVAECDQCCALVASAVDDTLIARLRGATSGVGMSVEGRLAERAADLQLPLELADHPRYRIVQMLGVGGMGVVYQAEHRLMQRTVALKVVRRSLVANPVAVERFRNEVRAAARLTHRNIVTVYDAEQAGTSHFLVMEFVDGVDLARLVEHGGPLPVAEACRHVREAALGLEHAYRQGMVHRDVKPQNLMLDRQGEIKILDFGLARLASEQSSEDVGLEPASAGLTSAGAVLGTLDYIAPEQIRHAPTADIRADLYSLGCTLYFLLTGRPPFVERSGEQKLVAHASELAPRVDCVRLDVPANVADIVERLMAKDPAQRWQTPAEVASVLEPLADATAAAWLPDVSARVRTDVRRPKRSRRRFVGWLAAVTLLMASLSAGWFHFTRQGSPGAAPPRDAIVGSANGPRSAAPILLSQRKPVRVLLVVPQEDYWYPDYIGVRNRLEQRGAAVLVASATRSPARPQSGGGGEAVRPDRALGEVRAEEFDAVVFTGGLGVRQYAVGNQSGAARKLIAEMLAADKYVAAICLGPVILAEAGVLDGRRATCYERAFDLIDRRSVDWVMEPVVVSEHIITGRDWNVAGAFVDALLGQVKTETASSANP